MESTGEDPYLNSQLAKAFVRGFQGPDLKNDPYRVAACVKHFAAYGAPEGGRDYNTIDMSERQLGEYDGMTEKVGAHSLLYAEGCGMETGTDEGQNTAFKIAKKADVIVLALGESSDMSGEAASRADIRLPQIQLDLVKKLKKANKPMIVVLFNGRPLDLHGIFSEVDAILEAWFPGTEGGAAISDLLFGDKNPSAKLSMSFPYSVGQIPVYYNHFRTRRPQNPLNREEKYVSKYLDIPNEPLFPVGFGLSYTTFSYHHAKLSHETMTTEKPLTLSVDVTNDGDAAGEEIVQLYIQDVVGEVVRPLKELKGFEKVMLNPGETRTVSFIITEEQLRYHHSIYNMKVIMVHLLPISVVTAMMFRLYLFS